MSRELCLAVHAAEFPAQALLRLRTDLRTKPIAVLDGRPPQETVCSLNRHASSLGAALGMTRLEAEAIGELNLLSRSIGGEATARTALLECAAQFSPRIEETSQGTACAFVLDIAGTEKLFGPPQRLSERLRASLTAAGFRVSIAVSGNFDAARMKAAAAPGITIIPDGEEANALAKLPITALNLPEEHKEIFALWGIRILDELAALPEVELVTRFGPQARDWRELARGKAQHTLQLIEPAFLLKEFCEFETPVEQIDSLLFIGARMIDCLAARAADRALSLASLTAQMELEGGRLHSCALRPAIPTTDRKFLLKLLQLEIGAHPPQAAVVSLTLTAEAGVSSKVQLGLFAPQTPEPSRLDVTLARLKAIVGEDRVGSPLLEDTHRGGSFRLQDFAVTSKVASPDHTRRMALRRMRPPLPVHVVLHDTKPTVFNLTNCRYAVTAAYGPWKSSGCWWSPEEWFEEQWDVLAVDGTGTQIACLLARGHSKDRWRLEAFYD